MAHSWFVCARCTKHQYRNSRTKLCNLWNASQVVCRGKLHPSSQEACEEATWRQYIARLPWATDTFKKASALRVEIARLQQEIGQLRVVTMDQLHGKAVQRTKEAR